MADASPGFLPKGDPPASSHIKKVKQEHDAKKDPPTSNHVLEEVIRVGIARDIERTTMYCGIEDVKKLKEKLIEEYDPILRIATSGGPRDKNGRPLWEEFGPVVNGYTPAKNECEKRGEKECVKFLEDLISTLRNLTDAYQKRVRCCGRSEEYWNDTAQWEAVKEKLNAKRQRHAMDYSQDPGWMRQPTALREVISFFFTYVGI